MERDEHYRKTLDNFALIGSDNLHFVGYFDDPAESLVSALHNLNRRIAELAGVASDDRVLDIGCGSGGPACAVSAITGCRVVGVDLGEAQLEHARRKAEEKNLGDRVRFQRADATRLPFDAASFSAVLMIGVGSNVEARDELFSEAARVLEHGGRLVFADAVANDANWFADRANAMPVRIIKALFASPHVEPLDEYRRLMEAHDLRLFHDEDLKPHVTRSFSLWTETLDDRKEEFIDRLGKARHRGLLKGVRVVGDVVEAGQVTFVLLAAKRGEDG
jgi:27-O-demethylrifamycin SV methyltransferase